MHLEKLAVRQQEIDCRAKSNTKRLDKLEREQEAIGRLATAVEILAKEQHHQTVAVERIRTEVCHLDTKVEALEHRPGKQRDKLVGEIFSVILALIVGYFAAKIGIYG